MRAIILAAGKGERMRPLTLVKPKPLLEVCGKSLIEHHIENLKHAGITDIVINVSWLAQQIMQKLGSGENYGVKIRYSYEGEEPLETGGGILKALPLLNEEPFLVVNGDIKTDFPFEKLLNKDLNSLAHLILVNNPPHNSSGDFSINDDESLNHISASSNKYTYSGIGIYTPELLKNLQAGTFSITPILKQKMQNSEITGELYEGQWDDIGTIERLLEINSKCKKN